MKTAETIAFAPTLLERAFALRTVSPFDRLTPAELVLLADIADARAYAPGEVVHPGGLPFPRLFAVVAGRVVDESGAPAGSLLGALSLIRHTDGPRLVADPATGARIIRLDRGPFFTILRECPAFTLGLLALGLRPATASPA